MNERRRYFVSTRMLAQILRHVDAVPGHSINGHRRCHRSSGLSQRSAGASAIPLHNGEVRRGSAKQIIFLAADREMEEMIRAPTRAPEMEKSNAARSAPNSPACVFIGGIAGLLYQRVLPRWFSTVGAAPSEIFSITGYGTCVKIALLVTVAVLVCVVVWEEASCRYEVFDISSTSNCCACKLTVIVLDKWTGKTDARSLPADPVSDAR